MSLASLTGRPIKIDAATRSLSRLSVACVYIEVNLLSSLPKRIWIGQGESGFWQSVTYYNLPQYCSICAKLGHSDNDSASDPTALVSQKIWKPKTLAPNPPVPTIQATPHLHNPGLSGLENFRFMWMFLHLYLLPLHSRPFLQFPLLVSNQPLMQLVYQSTMISLLILCFLLLVPQFPVTLLLPSFMMISVRQGLLVLLSPCNLYFTLHTLLPRRQSCNLFLCCR